MAGWLILVNRRAGARSPDLTRLRRALSEAGVEATIEVPGDRQEMRRAIAEAASGERMAVVGGDGTVSLAVDTLLGVGERSTTVLGVIPAGTGCDLIRTFGIPQRLEEAVHHLRGDGVYPIDVGEITGAWGTRRFVNVAQAGVGAAAAETSCQIPRRLGSSRYVLAFGARLPRFPRGEVRLVTERRQYTGPALAVIIANAQFFAGGWNIAPKATLVDGVFDLQVIDAAKRKAPSLVPKLIKGLHLREPGVKRIVAARFQLETEHLWPVEVDGDYLGNTPLTGRVLPAAISLKI